MVNVPATYGALLVGGLIALFLSGTVTVQSYLYFKEFPKDSPRTKLLAAFIWFLDVLHTTFIIAALWQYLIVQYGKAETVDKVPVTLALSIACTAILTFSVHCFFANRIYLFSRGNKFLTIAVVVLAFCRLCAASVTTGELIRQGTFSAYKRHFFWVFTLGLGLSSTVDVLITTSLCYFLRASRTESSKLNRIIDSLFLYTFENGALTTFATITSMVFWLTLSRYLVFMGLHFVIGKLYATSFLATLHARKKLRRGPSGTETQAPVTFLSDKGHHAQGSGSYGHARQHSAASTGPTIPTEPTGTKMAINVLKTVQFEADEDDMNRQNKTYEIVTIGGTGDKYQDEDSVSTPV